MAMEKLHLSIVSPENVIFEGDVDRVTLPGIKGSFSILPHHAPIISALGAGTLSYLIGGEEHVADIQSGFVEMSNNNVSVCVEEVAN